MAVVKIINAFGNIASSLLMFAITAIMTLQVVARYIFNAPFEWTEEICRILFVAMIFFGAISAEHIQVNAFTQKLKQAVLRKVNTFNLILQTFYFSSVIYLFIVYYKPSNSTATPMLEIGMYYLFAIAPLTFLLILIKDWIIAFNDPNILK